MNRTNLLGGVVFAAGLGLVLWREGGFFAFVDLPSVLLVGLGTLGITLLGYHPGQSRSALLRLAGGASFRCGMAGLVIGLVCLLRNLNEPAQIGPAVALSLLSVLYGVVLALLLEALALSPEQP